MSWFDPPDKTTHGRASITYPEGWATPRGKDSAKWHYFRGGVSLRRKHNLYTMNILESEMNEQSACKSCWSRAAVKP